MRSPSVPSPWDATQIIASTKPTSMSLATSSSGSVCSEQFGSHLEGRRRIEAGVADQAVGHGGHREPRRLLPEPVGAETTWWHLARRDAGRRTHDPAASSASNAMATSWSIGTRPAECAGSCLDRVGPGSPQTSVDLDWQCCSRLCVMVPTSSGPPRSGRPSNAEGRRRRSLRSGELDPPRPPSGPTCGAVVGLADAVAAHRIRLVRRRGTPRQRRGPHARPHEVERSPTSSCCSPIFGRP